MKNDGKGYEQFVQQLQQALIDSEEYLKQKNISIERNKKLKDSRNRDREFDLYWEYELAGVTYKTIIECKDYNSKISIDKIDAIVGKIQDFPDIKPVFATKVGYQKGAEEKAKDYKVELLIVREQKEEDWVNRFKAIDINLMMESTSRITSFVPKVNKDWVLENTNIDISKPMTISGNNNEIFIFDNKKEEKYSLYELAYKLDNISNGKFGNLTHSEEFEDAYILFGDNQLKMDSYKVEYYLSEPHKEIFTVDFSKELIGVIEYLDRNSTVAVFKDRIIKDWR